MSTVAPLGTASTASTKPWTGRVTLSGSASGNSSGSSTSTPMIRNNQRRSSRDAQSAKVTLFLPAQVRALDAENHAQSGRHHAEGGADQDRALRRVLRHVHDPLLDRPEPHRLRQ